MFRSLRHPGLLVILSAALVQAQNTDRQGATEPSSSTSASARQLSNAAQAPQTKLRSQAVLIQVPAVVTDRSGNHIRNLTKNDFVLFENGKQKNITLCVEVTATNYRSITPTGSLDTFSNLSPDEAQAHSVTVIVLDTVNTPFLDQAYGRAQLIKYLGEHLDSGAPMSLIAIGRKGPHALTGFVNDPAVLIKILQKVGGELPAMQKVNEDAQAFAMTNQGLGPLPGAALPTSELEASLRNFIRGGEAIEAAYQQDRATEDTIQAFLSIAWSLSGIPGRKSLVWATAGFPFLLDTPDAIPGDRRIAALYERAMEALNEAQVSVYPVDVRGLMSDGGRNRYSASTPGNASARNQIRNSATGSANALGKNELMNSTLVSLQNFADMTGGRSFYGNNDLVAGFRRAVEDSSDYYLLGYYFDSHGTKAGWQRLQVKSQRKDVSVRARTGFVIGRATLDPQSTRKADIDFALISPFDSTGIPVVLRWRGLRDDAGKKKAQFLITVQSASVVDETDKNRFDVEFAWQASRNGIPLDKAGQAVRGALSSEALAKIKADGVTYNNAIEVPSGDYQVRFVVRDNLNGRIGTVSAPLTVN